MRIASHRSFLANVAAGVAMSAAAAVPASAAVVYATGFENPPFVANQPLVGQDGWVDPLPFLNPAAATISTLHPAAGAQSVRIAGGDLATAPEVQPAYDAVGSYRRPLNYDAGAAGTPYVLVQSAVRLDGTPQTGGDFYSATLAAIAPGGVTIGELGVSSDGRVYGYASGAGVDAAPVQSRAVSLGAYHTLAIGLDFASDTLRYFVDGTALGGAIPFDPAVTGDVLTRASIVNYARADTAFVRRADYVSYYDDFSATAGAVPVGGGGGGATVPLPPAVWTGIVGAAGAVVARRRVIASSR